MTLRPSTVGRHPTVAIHRTPTRRGTAAGTAAAAAGPVLITACVLVVLQGFVFGGRISAQHVDPLSQALPSLCLLKSSIAAGHLPLWNPLQMGGLPFAADPQSGWLTFPAMALAAALPCGAALRVLIPLLPIMAGLGTYAFLRGEGVSRAGSTIAGLMLSLGIAASDLTLSFPFAGAIAWTAITLAAAGRMLRAETWSRRLAWLVAVSLAWGQIAAAHLSQGFVVGSMVVLAYLLGRGWMDVRAGRRTTGECALLIALAVVAVPAVNLALFLPRLAYLPHTSFALGYPGLDAAAAHIAGRPVPPAGVGSAVTPPWPLKLATSPGVYLGAAGLALSLAWWRRSSLRPLAVAFAACGAACYLLSLRVVAAALQPLVDHLPRGDVYLHAPWRFRFGVLTVVPLLAGIGFDALRAAGSWRERAWALAPGAAVWWLLPVAFAHPARLVLLAAGAVAGGAILLATPRRSVGPLLASVLAVELVAGALIGQGWRSGLVNTGVEPAKATVPLTPLLRPTLSLADYQTSDAIVRAALTAGGRVAAFDPADRRLDGYQVLLPRPSSWPLLANQRAQLFGLEDAEGYNPVQSPRYWSFVRTVDAPKLIRYNAAAFARLSPVALDLLQVNTVVGPADLRSKEIGPALAQQGGWAMFPVRDPAPRASVISSWTVVGSPGAALRAVMADGFDPSTRAVLEADPGIAPTSGPGGGRATYVQLTPDAARVDVVARHPAIVLVRNGYDPGWRATVDGAPTPVIAADSIDQAVAVPAGHHTILLTYHDPPVGFGLLGSGLALAGLLALAVVPAVRSRRRRPAPGRDQSRPVQNGEPGGGAGPPSNVVTR